MLNFKLSEEANSLDSSRLDSRLLLTHISAAVTKLPATLILSSHICKLVSKC